MIKLVHAEFVKLRTTQVWFWMLLAAMAVAALFVVAQIASNSNITPTDVHDLFTSSGTAYVVVFVLGVLGITTEFRYKTITSTVLTTPSRWALVGAKLIAYTLVSALYSLICILLTLAIALPWLSARGVSIGASDHLPHALGAVFVVVTLFGLIGIGFGALVKNQIVAVSIGVIWLLILNNLLALIPGVKYVYPYTPVGGLSATFAHTHDDRVVNGVTLLPGWGGVLVLLAWALIPAIIGASLSMTRDIT